MLVFVMAIMCNDVFSQDVDSLLVKAYERDQGVRAKTLELTRKIGKYGYSGELVDSLVMLSDKTENIDRENIALVDSLLNNGWPENLTKDSYNTLWIIIDHADSAKQEHYLPMIKKAAEKGDISYNNYAVLSDRIDMKKGLKQTYGTQSCIVTSDDGNEVIYIWPVRDALKLDSLRKKINECPIKKYVRTLEKESGIKTIYDPFMTVEELKRLSKNTKLIYE